GAGAAVGAPVGAALDPTDPRRGAGVGAVVGAGVAGGRRLARLARQAPARAPAYLKDPDVRRVLGPIDRGKPSTSTLRSRLANAAAATSPLARNVYTRLIDDIAPLRRFGRLVDKSDRLSHVATSAQGWQGSARARLETEFREVLKAARGHE